MYIIQVVLFVSLISFSLSLTCHCDGCNKEQTCTTDGGVCYKSVTKTEEGAVRNTYRCLKKEKLHPPDKPLFCQSSKSKGYIFAIECCKDKDLCNLLLNPTLSPTTTPAVITVQQEYTNSTMAIVIVTCVGSGIFLALSARKIFILHVLLNVCFFFYKDCK